MKLSKGLGCFYTEAVQVEILRVFAALEETLRFYAGRGADGHEGKTEKVHFAGGLRCEEISDREPAAFLLARESEAQQLCQPFLPERTARMRLRLRRFVHNYIIAIALSWEISVYNRWSEQSRFEDFVFQFVQNWPELLVDQ